MNELKFDEEKKFEFIKNNLHKIQFSFASLVDINILSHANYNKKIKHIKHIAG